MSNKADVASHRQASIELLRILAMLGVVTSHVFNNGLLIYDGFTVDVSTHSGFVLWSVLEILKLSVLVSVNCYVLITGYFLIDRHQLRLKGIWRVWSTTWCYALGIFLLAALLRLEPFTWGTLLTYATPVSSNIYWFVTSYLMLLLVAPLLSMAVQRLSKRQYECVLALGMVVCFQPLLGQFLIGHQKILLFVFLFLAGGYVRKYGVAWHTGRKLVAAVCAAILLTMYAYTLYKNMYLETGRYLIYSMAYHGLVLPLSVAFFLLMKDLPVAPRPGRYINAVASLSFAVYVIHEHPIVRQRLWSLVSPLLQEAHPWAVPFLCLLIAVAIFTVCILIEKARHLLHS